MNRVLAATRTDVALQARNQLYGISILFAAVMVGALIWLSSSTSLHRTVPMAVLFVVGGSTLLYIVAMVLLERDDGTLEAVSVSPLRPAEYLAAKVASLTALAVFEGVVLTGGTIVWLDPTVLGGGTVPLLLVGLVALGAMHTFIGVIIVVRYSRIMEALMPMGLVALVLQVPALYFVGALPSKVALLIPSAAPAMFLRGAFVPLATWEWAYAIVGTAITLATAAVWAHRAFILHIIHKGVRA
jgi:fluoroquinolone transport system permease protein